MLSRILAVVAIAAIGSSAAAQVGSEATLFANSHFKGYGKTVDGPTRSMDPLTVKSIRISDGTAWDLCSGNTFTGCKRFSRSTEALVMTVRSARPVAPPLPASASAGGVSGNGASLRGLASEFFVMPEQGGRRVEVPGTVGALQEQATQFCRVHGWRSSVHEREQSVNGHSYLADVLCADENP